MIYFCKAHCVSSKDAEKNIYIILSENEPKLTKEILGEDQQFKEFIHDHRPKVVYVDYAVYSTDETLDNNM